MTGLFEKAMSVKFCFAIFFIIFENMLVLHIIRYLVRENFLGFKKNFMCSPIRNGGFGVRKLGTFNQAMLGKWIVEVGH